MSERHKLAVLFNLTAPSNSGKTAVLGFVQRHFEERGEKVARVKYPVYWPLKDHGVIDYGDIGRRINDYIRGGNPEGWDVRTAQRFYAQNRLNFDPTIARWMHDKDLILQEDGKWTSIIWGPLMDPSVTRGELIRLNIGVTDPDIMVTLRGPRLGGIELNHLFEESELHGRVRQEHLNLANQLGWRVVDYCYRDSDIERRDEITRVGMEMVTMIDDFRRGRVIK